MSTYCCMENCWKNKSKHRFPNPSKDRISFDRWVNVCDNRGLIKEMLPEQVYNNYRVCSLHFVPQDFGMNENLKKGVVPSVQLREPLGLAEEISKSVAPTNSDSATTSTHLETLNICESDNQNENVFASTSKQTSSVLIPSTPEIDQKHISPSFSQK